MSQTVSGLGTNQYTYAHNPDRSGQWATYLSDLALQNSHDRQRVNGELNASTGMVDKNPIPSKNLNDSLTKVKVPERKERIKKYKQKGYNPRYFRAGS
jgi:hypothetical protein